MRITIKEVINIPFEVVENSITSFIRSFFKESQASCILVGLSGGLDSSVLLALLARSVPPDRIVGLILPDSRATPSEDVNDALELARSTGIKHYVVYIDRILDSYTEAPFVKVSDSLETGNLRARIRMCLLYYYANKCNGVVAGSSDRSELIIGYYTKYGDGAADFLPLGCLYKTQVRELGMRLGLPLKIVNKPSAPRLWKGHTAQSELGYSYEEIDLALYTLFDLKLSLEDAVSMTGLPRGLYEKLLSMNRKSRHKMMPPPIPKLPWISDLRQ
ncbi:MAG: NAD+ synthase [Desulfurococcaceae archaeon]